MFDEDFFEDNTGETRDSAFDDLVPCLKGDFVSWALFFAFGLSTVAVPAIGFLERSNLPCGAGLV